MAKSLRSITDINQEYFQTAAILGDLVWKVSKFTGESLGAGQIDELKRKLRVIDNEMDEVQKAQAKQESINKDLAEKRKAKSISSPSTIPQSPIESIQDTVTQ
jgi:hypothetical protein